MFWLSARAPENPLVKKIERRRCAAKLLDDKKIYRTIYEGIDNKNEFGLAPLELYVFPHDLIREDVENLVCARY